MQQSGTRGSRDAPLVLPFDAVGIGDVGQVGGKNASLGELRRHLTAAGVRVPDGFAVTAAAYRSLIAAGHLEAPIRGAIEGWRGGVPLGEAGEAIRTMLGEAALPPQIARAIRTGYRALCERIGRRDIAVAVRSSATAEDLPDASFAGQQETYL
ncbi:MAG: phosphoenolpyruvate synthase, partial [Sphingomonadales bacterium]